MELIPRNVNILPSDEDYQCCEGEPPTHEECPVCGCREAGNASYVCPEHYSFVNRLVTKPKDGKVQEE